MTTKLTHLAGLLLLLSGLGLSAPASADTPNRPEDRPALATMDAAAKLQQKTNGQLAWQRVGSPISLES